MQGPPGKPGTPGDEGNIGPEVRIHFKVLRSALILRHLNIAKDLRLLKSMCNAA